MSEKIRKSPKNSDLYLRENKETRPSADAMKRQELTRIMHRGRNFGWRV